MCGVDVDDVYVGVYCVYGGFVMLVVVFGDVF